MNSNDNTSCDQLWDNEDSISIEEGMNQTNFLECSLAYFLIFR